MSLIGQVLGTGVINITANILGFQQALGQANNQFAAFQQKTAAWRASMPTWAAAQQAGMNVAQFRSAMASWRSNKPVAPPPGGGGGGGGSGGLAGVGGSIAFLAATTAGVVALKVFAGSLKAAADAASNYQEAVAKSEQSFGSYKGIVGKQADELANKYGVSRRETHELSSRAGLLLQGAGVDEKSSAKMGANLSKLAAEASSFFNVPVEEAMNKIQSGLSGMSRPLREFGVLITDAKVKAKAFEMGLVGTNGVVTDAAKTVARYALITQGLARSEGDIERSQGRYSMQVRMVQGNLENLVSTIGESVLPAFTFLTSALNGLIQMTERWWKGLGYVGAALGDLAGRAIYGGVTPAKFDASSAVPEDNSEIDARNQALIDDQLQLSAEEAAMKKGGHRGANYTDLQGLNKQIQDAISGNAGQQIREQTDIAKKTLDVQKRIAKGIEDMNKKRAGVGAGFAADGTPF